MKFFRSFSGRITMIRDLWTEDPQQSGCVKYMTVVDSNGGIVDFVVTPDTYFVDHVMMKIGDEVTGYYDASLPVPAIYPPPIWCHCHGQGLTLSKCETGPF